MSKAEIVKSLQDKISSAIRVSLPCVIESYDYKTQKADIRVDIKELYNNNTELEYPILVDVPVIFPRSGGASITLPVKQGDSCLVIFLDRDITNWLLGASKQKPATKRIHHLSDAVAIVGLNPFTKPSLAENNDDLLLTYSGSNIRLRPNGIVDIHSAKEVNIKTENVIINCKNATVKAEELISAECKNIQVKSSNSAAIECKIGNINASDSVNIETKIANIKAIDTANIECVNAQIKASSTINTETPNFTQNGDMKVNGNIEITGTSLVGGLLTTNNGINNSGGNLVSSGKTFETHTHAYEKPVAGSEPTATVPNSPTGVAQ